MNEDSSNDSRSDSSNDSHSGCFYFGCWNRPGHYLYRSDGSISDSRIKYFGHIKLDGTLAPRRMKRDRRSSRAVWLPEGSICWAAQGKALDERRGIIYDSVECDEGQFLLHYLSNGFTAIQWHDRSQGDSRGGCNSTILLAGNYDAAEMLSALHVHFPHVEENLSKAGVQLVEVRL